MTSVRLRGLENLNLNYHSLLLRRKVILNCFLPEAKSKSLNNTFTAQDFIWSHSRQEAGDLVEQPFEKYSKVRTANSCVFQFCEVQGKLKQFKAEA